MKGRYITGDSDPWFIRQRARIVERGRFTVYFIPVQWTLSDDGPHTSESGGWYGVQAEIRVPSPFSYVMSLWPNPWSLPVRVGGFGGREKRAKSPNRYCHNRDTRFD